MNTNFKYKLLKPASLIGLLAIFSMILAACAPAAAPVSTPPVTQPSTTQPGSTSSTPAIDIASDPTLGQYLTDGNGRTLYVDTSDAPDASSCNAACQANWPPLLTSVNAKAGPGVDASMISVTTLAGGEKIVTYDHRPLYYKSTDQKLGDKTGEGVNNMWYVVSPAGAPVNSTGAAVGTPTAAPTSSAATPTSAASSGSATATPAATPAPTQITEPSIAVTKDPKLGDILTANNGMTLYAYTLDTKDASNCSAVCQKAWIPLLTMGSPTLGTGVTASMIGNTKLADGNMVVTYNHMPLYFFVNDTSAGQSNGQGFDNVWFAVSPVGSMVGKASEVSINLATNPILGGYLVGQGGQAMYVYTNDTPDKSTCTGACAANWPPVITLGKPNLGNGVDSTMIGTVKLPDGSLVLTYNHKPLYYFVGDSKPTDIKGQAIKNVWYVLGADGNNITYSLPVAPTSEPTIDVATNSTYGQILTDGNAMSLYINTSELKGETSCLATCLQSWTPLYTLGHPNLGPGVDPSLVGTLTTTYGLMIVTYNNHPLYLYTGDKNAGDTNGEGANIVWYLVSAKGTPIVAR